MLGTRTYVRIWSFDLVANICSRKFTAKSRIFYLEDFLQQHAGWGNVYKIGVGIVAKQTSMF